MPVYLVIGDADTLSEIANDLEGRLEVLQDDGAGDTPDASDIQAASEWLNEARKGDLQFLAFPIQLEFDDSNVLNQIKLTLENLNDGRKEPLPARVVEELDQAGLVRSIRNLATDLDVTLSTLSGTFTISTELAQAADLLFEASIRILGDGTTSIHKLALESAEALRSIQSGRCLSAEGVKELVSRLNQAADAIQGIPSSAQI
ncbi:hypothetical protein [Microvirga tunisiensis]|uniref:Uncharacterized protein n=1 Tax=Microvirga tunisiensis TaxID=2108360 RepID=A0A5N7MNX1_9HYPH|nr:hypothetical protein [Microvirga tunisiensis]MPR10144.1 hypothetical protein [Microvirga tunisiensis]MPR28350.1 hypothetical protein [Microvirga tunisiensis]